MFLNTLNGLSQEYKVGRRRQILMQTIFAKSHNRINVATSKGIVFGLKTKEKSRARLMCLKEFNHAVFLKEFRAIALLSRLFPTTQSIIDAMGELPDLEEEELLLIEETATGDTNYADFVEELMDNAQSFQTAALIKPIWAGFNIPIFNSHPSEQPLGGVSDLSNKGDFDKLLVSEFANDDLVFMNRIANNEALYLHREMPPVKDKLNRTILIDVSLKNWGTPKILSFASYIAIARHPKASSESKAFVVGSNCIPVACNNKSAVIDALQHVDAGLHAGKGLADFLETNKHDKQLEIFYITSAEAIKYPEVQQQLAAYQSLFRYIVITNADGEINFYRRRNNTQKHLQTIRLPLEKLWKRNATKSEKQSLVSTAQTNLPVLLPTPKKIKKILPLGDEEVYCVTERCLIRRSAEHNRKSDKGWETILSNIPSNSLYEIGKDGNDAIIFLSFNLQTHELFITNLTDLSVAKTIFKETEKRTNKEFIFNKQSNYFCYHLNAGEGFEFRPNFKTGIVDVKKINLKEPGFVDFYIQRQKQIKDFPAIFSRISILRNISDVYISQDNYLVFNTHQLQIMHGEQLYFCTYGNPFLKKIQAIRTSNKREFHFKDGSTVSIENAGYIKLTSSNEDIPDIYLSAVLDSPLGMATKYRFAGNNFYYNDNFGKVSVELTEKGSLKLEAIKIIRNYTDLGLKGAKEVVDGSQKLSSKKIDADDAKKMQEELHGIGCSTTIETSANAKQLVIAANTFYLENIATFIGNIINHVSAD